VEGATSAPASGAAGAERACLRGYSDTDAHPKVKLWFISLSLNFKQKGDNHGLHNREKFVGMRLYILLLRETRKMLRMRYLSQNEKSSTGLFLYKRGRKNIRQVVPVFRERPQVRLRMSDTNSNSKIE
jgi:hypothetical protein